MRITFLCLVIFAGITSCKKDTLDISSYWQCNKSQNLDSAAISGKLIGTWTWSKQFCGLGGATESANKNITVTFSNNHTFTVNENSNILTQGTWKLIPGGNVDSWQLDMSSPSEYLYGMILFCDNQVLFNNSYIDGCDNLFNGAN